MNWITGAALRLLECTLQPLRLFPQEQALFKDLEIARGIQRGRSLAYGTFTAPGFEMRAPMLLAVAVLTAAPVVTALADTDYSATVRQSYVPATAIKRVAILPVACTENIECDELEKKFAKSMRDAAGLELVPSRAVLAVMHSAQIATINYETRYILAESLKVDAFATLEVRQAAVEKGETTYVKLGVAKIPQEAAATKHVQLALQMVASDGTVLLDATGEAHLTNSLRGLNGIAERVCERMIEASMSKRD